MIPQSFMFSNARWFGSRRISYDLSGQGIMLYHAMDERGTSVVTSLLRAFLYQEAIIPEMFDDIGQPLVAAMTFSDGQVLSRLEMIYYIEAGYVRRDCQLFEWKSVSNCYVPVTLPKGSTRVGDILKKISESIHISVKADLKNLTADEILTFPEISEINLDRADKQCSLFKQHLNDLKRFYSETDSITLVSETDENGITRFQSPLKVINMNHEENTTYTIIHGDQQESDNKKLACASNFINPLHRLIIRYAELYFSMVHAGRMIDNWQKRAGDEAGKDWNTVISLLNELSLLEERRQQHDDLLAGIHQVEQVIAKLEDEMKLELHTGQTQMNEKRAWAAKLHEYEKELEIHHRELVRLQKIQDKHKHVLEQGLLDKTKLEFLERWIDEHKTYVDKEQAAIETVTSNICPDCGKPLDDTEAAQLKKTIQERMEFVNGKIFEFQIESDEIRHTMDKLRETYADLEKELKQQPTVWHQYYTTEHRLQIARQYEKEYQILKEQTDRIKQNLSSRSFARRELKAVDDMQKQLQKTDYLPSRLRAVRMELQDKMCNHSDSVLSSGLQREIKKLVSERSKIFQELLLLKNEIRETAGKYGLPENYEKLFDTADDKQFLRCLIDFFNETKPDCVVKQIHGNEKEKFLVILDQVIETVDDLRTVTTQKQGVHEKKNLSESGQDICKVQLKFTELIFNFFVSKQELTLLYASEPNKNIEINILRSGRLVSLDSLTEQETRMLEIAFRCSAMMLDYCLGKKARTSVWFELPFLLHGKDFISKIRAVMNDVMFWTHHAVVISPDHHG